MLFDQIGKLQQQILSFERSEFAPGAFERAPGCGDCTIDVRLVAFRDGGEQLAGGRVVTLEGLARGCVDPFAVDQHLLGAAIGVRMAIERDGLSLRHGFSLCLVCEYRYIHTTIKRISEPSMTPMRHGSQAAMQQ